MRRLAIGLVPWLLLVGCSDDGVPADTDSAGSTGASAGDDEGVDDGDASITATGTTAATTASTTVSTTDSDSSGDSNDEGTTGNDDTTTTEGTDTTAGDSSTTGAPAMCEGPDECVLVNDCCSCTAIHTSEEPPECDIDACLQSTCDAMNIQMPAAVCNEGSCEVVPQSCDQALVTCESLPPKCPPDSVPGVDPNTMCWTGFCVPVELCPPPPPGSCDDCVDGEACVEYVSQLPQTECLPIPEDCNGTPTCACMGDIACQDPFTICNDVPGGISCGCPVCG